MNTASDEIVEAFTDLKDWIDGQRDHCYEDEIEAQQLNLRLIASAAGVSEYD